MGFFPSFFFRFEVIKKEHSIKPLNNQRNHNKFRNKKKLYNTTIVREDDANWLTMTR